MNIRFKVLLNIFKKAFNEWVDKDPFRESAVIAYYAIFSLPGLLVLVLALAGYFFGRDAVNNHISTQIQETLGAETAIEIQTMIVKASEAENSIPASIIAVITIIVGATGVFVQLQKSLNTIWGVKTKASTSIFRDFLKERIFSFGLIVSISFILMVSLVISAMLAAFGNWLAGHFSISFLVFMQATNFILSIVILTTMFAVMFKYLPDVKIKWQDVWVGSIVTSVLFELGKSGLALYFGKANPGTGYGAAGSVILIMLWVSYSSMIVFYGAEFTRAYASIYTDKTTATIITPDEISYIKE